MDEKFDQAFQQAAAFQKMWSDAFAQMADVWGRFSPDSPPPDTVREMRAGMLKLLTEAWDEFMRTPQFMEYMKTSMDGFLNMRKMAADAMTRNHHEMQSPAREDIDSVLLAIRHMERRLLDRIEDVESAVSGVGRRLEKVEKQNSRSASTPTPRARSSTSRSSARKSRPRRE